jgi:hypothetical protein
MVRPSTAARFSSKRASSVCLLTFFVIHVFAQDLKRIEVLLEIFVILDK